MQSRMRNPAVVLPGAVQHMQAVMAAAAGAGVPQRTLDLIHHRASQLNGCHACLEFGRQTALQHGETEDRLEAVEHWRTSEAFNDDERAALALAEDVTRLERKEESVSDEVWNEAARRYDEAGMAALLTYVGMTNLFNRLNIASRQAPGSWL